MSKIRLVVFDLIGTLVEDTGWVLKSFQAALTDRGLRLTNDDLQPYRGMSKSEMIRKLLPKATEEDYKRLMERFRFEFSKVLEKDGVVTMPGADWLLDTLQNSGRKIALTSGLELLQVQEIVRRAGWGFSAIVTADMVQHGRPSPDLILHAMKECGVVNANEVATIGDTRNDLLAGISSGARLVMGYKMMVREGDTTVCAVHDLHQVVSIIEAIE